MPEATALVVLSHGSLARGLVEAGSMIVGKSPDLHYVCLNEGEGPESFRQEVDAILNGLTGSEVLFMVDLFGGTPSNTASMVFLEHMTAPPPPGSRSRAVGIVTGVNLGMLLEAMSHQASMGAEELVSHLIEVSPTTVVDVGQMLREEVRNQMSPQGSESKG